MPAFTYKGHEILKCVPFIMSLGRAVLSRRTPTSAATSRAQRHDKWSMMELGPWNDHTCADVCQSQITYSAENSKNHWHAYIPMYRYIPIHTHTHALTHTHMLVTIFPVLLKICYQILADPQKYIYLSKTFESWTVSNRTVRIVRHSRLVRHSAELYRVF